MARYRVGAMLALGLAAQAHAVSLTLGYANIPGNMYYYREDWALPIYNSTTVSEKVNIGVVTVGGEQIVALDDVFGIGIEIGASMPGTFKFDETKRVHPDYGDPNPFSGDATEMTFMQVPILARLEARAPMEMMEFTLGLGAGLVAHPWNREFTNEIWCDGTPYSDQNDKDATHRIPYGVFTSWSSGIIGLPTVEIIPGLHMKMGEKTMVGIEVPLAFSPKTKIAGSELDREIPEPYVSNPDIFSDIWEFGGFTWAVRLAITRKL